MDPNISAGKRSFKKPFHRRGALINQVLILAILIFLPVLGITNPETAYSEEEGKVSANPHNYYDDNTCSVCHGDEPPSLSFDPVTTCAKCHPGNMTNHPVTRHPIGKMPKIKIPAKLPLTDDGEMVCYTCHDPHNKSRYPKMLRVDYLRLCASCHVGY